MAGAIMALALGVGTTAWAGSCCDTTAKAAKEGKTCAACETQACCKEAASKAADAKPCEKCTAKAKEKEKA